MGWRGGGGGVIVGARGEDGGVHGAPAPTRVVQVRRGVAPSKIKDSITFLFIYKYSVGRVGTNIAEQAPYAFSLFC